MQSPFVFAEMKLPPRSGGCRQTNLLPAAFPHMLAQLLFVLLALDRTWGGFLFGQVFITAVCLLTTVLFQYYSACSITNVFVLLFGIPDDLTNVTEGA